MLPVVYGVGDSFKESGSEILITTVEIFLPGFVFATRDVPRIGPLQWDSPPGTAVTLRYRLHACPSVYSSLSK